MRSKKEATVNHSSLEKIKGIGPAKAKALLTALGGLGVVRSASPEQLSAVKGITEQDVKNITEYFKK